MKLIKFHYTFIVLAAIIAMQACKPKKMVQKSEPAEQTVKPAPVEQPKPQPAETKPAVASVKNQSVDINAVKVQFDFDSSVLRTDSYPLLDQVASEIKQSPSITYYINGYASIEGTKEHNIILSADRANAVKTYLVNSGVNAANLITKGFGIQDPVADNSTDEGRVLNRRVEIKTQR